MPDEKEKILQRLNSKKYTSWKTQEAVEEPKGDFLDFLQKPIFNVEAIGELLESPGRKLKKGLSDLQDNPLKGGFEIANALKETGFLVGTVPLGILSEGLRSIDRLIGGKELGEETKGVGGFIAGGVEGVFGTIEGSYDLGKAIVEGGLELSGVDTKKVDQRILNQLIIKGIMPPDSTPEDLKEAEMEADELGRGAAIVTALGMFGKLKGKVKTKGEYPALYEPGRTFDVTEQTKDLLTLEELSKEKVPEGFEKVKTIREKLTEPSEPEFEKVEPLSKRIKETKSEIAKGKERDGKGQFRKPTTEKGIPQVYEINKPLVNEILNNDPSLSNSARKISARLQILVGKGEIKQKQKASLNTIREIADEWKTEYTKGREVQELKTAKPELEDIVLRNFYGKNAHQTVGEILKDNPEFRPLIKGLTKAEEISPVLFKAVVDKRGGKTIKETQDVKAKIEEAGRITPIKEKPIITEAEGEIKEGTSFREGKSEEVRGIERPFAFDKNSTQNEGRFRLKPPEDYMDYFRRKSSTEGVSYIMGTPKEGGNPIIQAIRFNKSLFTEGSAKQWFETNKNKFEFTRETPRITKETKLEKPVEGVEGVKEDWRKEKDPISRFLQRTENEIKTRKTEEEINKLMRERDKIRKQPTHKVPDKIWNELKDIARGQKEEIIQQKIKSGEYEVIGGQIVKKQELPQPKPEIKYSSNKDFAQKIKNMEYVGDYRGKGVLYDGNKLWIKEESPAGSWGKLVEIEKEKVTNWRNTKKAFEARGETAKVSEGVKPKEEVIQPVEDVKVKDAIHIEKGISKEGRNILGNFNKKYEAEKLASEIGGKVRGYLNGKYKVGWLVEKTEQIDLQKKQPYEIKRAKVIGERPREFTPEFDKYQAKFAGHRFDVWNALESGKLTKEKYNELHAKDYGKWGDEDFNLNFPDLQKKEAKPEIKKAQDEIDGLSELSSNAILDPKNYINSIKWGANIFKEGITKFTDWSTRMIKDLGEKVKPHLLRIWSKIRSIGKELAETAVNKVGQLVESKFNPARPLELTQEEFYANRRKYKIKTEELTFRGKAGEKTGITEKDILKNRELFKKRHTVIEKAKESIKAEKESVHFWTRKHLKPKDTRLYEIDPEIYRAVKQADFNKEFKHRGEERIANNLLFDLKEKVSKDTWADLDLLFKNERETQIRDILKKIGLEKEFDKVKDMLENFREELGIKKEKDFYFPREVRDYEGFIKNYEKILEEKTGKEFTLKVKDILDRLIENKEAKKGDKLTIEEKAKLINNTIRGYNPGVRLSKFKNEFERVIKVLDAEMAQYYHDFDASLMSYIEEARTKIEARKFFGKQSGESPAVNEYSIGRMIAEGKLRTNKPLKAEHIRELTNILKSGFEPKGTHGWVNTVKELGYATKLFNYINAITQLGDYYVTLYRAPIRGIGSVSRAFLSKTKLIKLSKLQLSEIAYDARQMAREFSDPRQRGKLMRKTSEWSLFKEIDVGMKETQVNMMFDKYKRLSKSGKLKKGHPDYWRFEKRFGEKADEVIKEFAKYDADNMTGRMAFQLWDELDANQPISVWSTPEGFHTSGQMQIAWQMKTFALRRLDFLMNESIRRVRDKTLGSKQRRRALKNLFYLLGAIVLTESSTDIAKDVLRGRKINIPDTVLDNLLGLVLMSRYDVSKIRRDGLASAIYDKISPVLGAIDDIGGDLIGAFTGKPTFKTMRNIPVVGNLIYEWTKESAKKKSMKPGR